MITSISVLRMRRTRGSGRTSGEGSSVTMSGCAARHLAGRAPAGFEQPPQLPGGLGGADDRRAAAAGPAGAVGEGAYRFGGRADRHEVGAGVAERTEPAVRVPAPHLAAEAPGVESGGLDARGHEGVGDGLALEDGECGAEVAWAEDPGSGLSQHVRGLTVRSSDPRTVPGVSTGVSQNGSGARPGAGLHCCRSAGRQPTETSGSPTASTTGGPEGTPSFSICSAIFSASSMRSRRSSTPGRS